MKAWVLAVSLAVNAVLLGRLAVTRRATWAGAPAPERALRPPQGRLSPPAGAHAVRLAWSALDGANPADLAGRLREAQVPEDLVRALVAAKIHSCFAPRLRALLEPDSDAAPVPAGPWGSGPGDAWRVEEFSRVVRARTRALREALGDSYYDDPRCAAAARDRFGDLPPRALDAVRTIEDDYADLAGQARSAARGARDLEDPAALDLIEGSRQADLAAVLTAGQYAVYRQGHRPLTAETQPDPAEAERQWALANPPFQP